MRCGLEFWNITMPIHGPNQSIGLCYHTSEGKGSTVNMYINTTEVGGISKNFKHT